jgi:hypothetical protein
MSYEKVAETIENVKNLNFGDEDLDEACLLRLEKLAMDKGSDGKICIQLLKILRDTLINSGA